MTEHYFSEKPTSELKIIEIKGYIFDEEIKLLSASGLFSKDRIDKGSKLLIEKSIIKNNSSVLDLGCGYGVVGICITKKYNTNTTFTDINERAIELTKKNCKIHKIKNYSIIQSNSFQNIKEKFDTILLNPPQTAGKELCFEMISTSKNFLNMGGSLQIVARHKKGGESLSKYMQEIFGNLSTNAKSGGFRIYISRN